MCVENVIASRRSACVATSIILLAISVFLSPDVALAQVQSVPAGQQKTLSRPQQTASVTYTAVPKFHFMFRANAPFSAEQHGDELMAVHDGTVQQLPTWIMLIYQDSVGRRRTDRHVFGMATGEDFRVSIVVYEIQDPVAGFRYIVDPQNHIVHRSTLEGQPIPPHAELGPFFPGMRPSGVEPHTKVERLGERDILGVSTTGFRRTTTFGPDPNDPIPEYTTTSETWISQQLWLPLLTKTTRGTSTNSMVAIVKLTLKEPDASLFRIPESYSVVDEVAPFQMKFTEPPKLGEVH
jgi:hypothetical protein